MDAVIGERNHSSPSFPDEEKALAGDERVRGGQLLLLLHRRPHREHLGSLHHREHNLHGRLFLGKNFNFTPWTSQPAVINFVQRDSRVPSLLNLMSLFSLVSHQHLPMLGFFTLCKFWHGPISGSSTPPAPPTPSVPHISHALSNFNLTKPLDRTGALLCILCFSSAFFSEK